MLLAKVQYKNIPDTIFYVNLSRLNSEGIHGKYFTLSFKSGSMTPEVDAHGEGAWTYAEADIGFIEDKEELQLAQYIFQRTQMDEISNLSLCSDIFDSPVEAMTKVLVKNGTIADPNIVKHYLSEV